MNLKLHSILLRRYTMKFSSFRCNGVPNRVGIGSTFQNPTRPEPDDLQPEPDPNPNLTPDLNPNPTRIRSVYKCRY